MARNSKEYQREYYKSYIQKRKALGLCKNCNTPSDEGSIFCERHRLEGNLYTQSRRNERRKNGVCVHCKRKISKTSKSFCDYHMKNHTSTKKYEISHYSKLKSRANKRDIPFTISKKDFELWIQKQDKQCFYCCVDESKLQSNTDIKKRNLTIDRKNNKLGYEIENICLCCFRCNNSKSNFFSCEEWLKIAKEFIRPRLMEYQGINTQKGF